MSAIKKKLLFVNGHLNTGGIEKTLIDLLSFIDYSKYEVDLLLFQGFGDYSVFLDEHVRVLSFDVRATYGAFSKVLSYCIKTKQLKLAYFRLIELLSRTMGKKAYSLLKPILPIHKRYDCAIAYRTGFCSEVVAYSVVANKKLCWWHNGEFNYSGKAKIQLGEVLSSFSSVVAVSEGWKTRLKEEFPELVSIEVMYNVLNADKIDTMAGSVPDVYNGVQYPIVSVGNLTKRKHFDNIVYVCSQLLKRGYSFFRWFIVGGGEEYDQIRELINNYQLDEYIIMLGKQKNPYSFIKHAKLFVHPSYGEAHCTAILEAMALGTPCVVTETYVPQDFTTNGFNCVEVSRNAESLLEGVVYLLDHPQTAIVLANNAKKQVINSFSPDVIMKSFYRIID